jgi:hypothetical protein
MKRLLGPGEGELLKYGNMERFPEPGEGELFGYISGSNYEGENLVLLRRVRRSIATEPCMSLVNFLPRLSN